MTRKRMSDVTDEWFEQEPSTRDALVQEVQRMARRFRARPLPVLVLAAALTALVTWRLAVRKQVFEAEIVLALSEGAMASKNTNLPVEQLRDFVDGVLIPDAKLRELIERRDLYRLRKTLGMEYAIEQLRSQLDIQVWKNSFVYFDADIDNAEHSARIGISVTDNDPDKAFTLAHDIGEIVMTTAREHDTELGDQLATEIAALRTGVTDRLDGLAHTMAADQEALDAAQKRHQDALAQTLALRIAELAQERTRAEKSMSEIATSRDALADRIAAAGLDTHVAVVEEHRPDRPEHRAFVLALVAIVVGFASLIGSALVLGAFDSRIHESEDVERLGLPVLGHVPGFAGDEVGSLARRGPALARVPSQGPWRRRY
jgi:capsular polysaccharide biosynthesis protein